MSMPPPPPPPPPGGFPPAPLPPPPGYVGYDARPAAPFAGWGSRAIGAIVNGIISSVFTAPGRLVSGDAPALGLLLTLAGTIAWIVIYAKQVGSTGQAWGHKVAGVRIVDADTGQVIPHWSCRRPLLRDDPVGAALLPRLPVAAVGREEADLPRQDRQHLLGHRLTGPAR